MNRLFRYPPWLQGSVSFDSDTPWQTYIQETLDKTYAFLQAANGVLVVLYVTVALILTLATRPSAFSGLHLRSVVGRLLATHGIVAFMTWATLQRVQRSEWGSSIRSGKTFMRPFPVDAEFTSERWQQDPTIPQGLTTLPERMDILFGRSRFV